MTIAFWCVLIAILLPYLFTGFAKFQGGFGPRENHNPRDFLNTLEGPRQRAHWAQQNSFEIMPGFIAAVIIAQLAHTAPQATIDGIAVTFVVSRLLYGICYIGDWASARSLVWFFGIGCIIALFVGTGG